jgi:HAE1 family hydrophobic/amphiphilic exporter-1
MDLAFLNVREKLDQVQYIMPEQSSRPQLVMNTTADEPIAVLTITSKDRPNDEFDTRLALKRWAEQVFSRRLEQAEGIAQVVPVGAVEPEVQIRYKPREIDRYGLSLSEVQQIVREANLFTSSGELRDGWYRYSMKIESRIQELGDLESVPIIRLGEGRILTLGEVAEIDLVESDPVSFSMIDGVSVLSLLVKKEFGSNTVEVFDTLLPLVEQMREQYPEIQIEILREDATFIRNAINNLLQTLLIGGILAFFILFAFLNDIRTPFTIGIAIPVSIFITFFVMYGSGIQLNIVSLSGLTLGIGLLLDNAIVVLENINRHMPAAPSVKRAAAVGTKEIALAVTASTFTTISVFLPLIFLGGFEGAFFKDQAYTLSISLLASLFVALVILPVLVVQILERKKNRGVTVREMNRLNTRAFFNRLLDLYENSLQKVIKRPFFAIVIAVMLVIVAGYAFMTIPKSLLPEDKPSEVTYRIQLPGNTALNSSADAAGALRLRLMQNGLGGNRIQVQGGFTDQTNLTSLSQEGLNKFTITVPVRGFDDAEAVRSVIEQFDEDFQGWSVEPVSSGQSWSALIGANQPPVLFRFVGLNRVNSESASEELQQKLEQSGFPVEFQKQYEQEVQTWNLRFRSERLLQLGIQEQEIIRYLESISRGSFVTDWNRGDERIGIRLMGQQESLSDPANVNLRIGGREIPLNYVAEISRASEPEQLERVDQTPVLSYVANWSLTEWWWNGSKTIDIINQFMQETGSEVQIAGNAMMVQSLMEDMGKLLLLSILIIYIILAVQFENIIYPLIIITAVPFAWVGSLILMWVTGSGLNAMSFMGVLILTGIAVNDSILKVDFMRRYLNETGNLKEAVILAGKHRFRPVVMTSVTTILGLVPMLIPFGDGYVFRQSLAIALTGGMITSTILTLYLIPVLFGWVERAKMKVKS